MSASWISAGGKKQTRKSFVPHTRMYCWISLSRWPLTFNRTHCCVKLTTNTTSTVWRNLWPLRKFTSWGLGEKKQLQMYHWGWRLIKKKTFHGFMSSYKLLDPWGRVIKMKRVHLCMTTWPGVLQMGILSAAAAWHHMNTEKKKNTHADRHWTDMSVQRRHRYIIIMSWNPIIPQLPLVSVWALWCFSVYEWAAGCLDSGIWDGLETDEQKPSALNLLSLLNLYASFINSCLGPLKSSCKTMIVQYCYN